MNKTNTVGERINSVRKKQDLTLDAFAQKIGVSSRGLVHGWINNKSKPNKERLERIARLGGVTVNWLLYGVDDFMPPIPVYSPIQIAYTELDNPLFHIPYSSIKELADLYPNEEYFFIMGEKVVDKYLKLTSLLTEKKINFNNSEDVYDLIRSEEILKHSVSQYLGLDENNMELSFFQDFEAISLYKRVFTAEEIENADKLNSVKIAFDGFLIPNKRHLFVFDENLIERKLYSLNQLSTVDARKYQNVFWSTLLNENTAIFYKAEFLEIKAKKLLTSKIIQDFISVFTTFDIKLRDIIKAEQENGFHHTPVTKVPNVEIVDDEDDKDDDNYFYIPIQ